MARTFHLVTFGCKVNQYETQALREAWIACGAVETDDPACAEVVCLNSCAVTMQAVSDARKALRRLRREAPAARLVLTGCAAARIAGTQTDVTPLVDVNDLPGVELVLGPDRKPELLRLFAAENGSPCPVAEKGRVYPPFTISDFRRSRPVLKVQDGCTQGCAYCIVPLTRGPSRSRAPEETLDELHRLLAAGFREIMISGINLRQYAVRSDSGELTDFWELLRYLDAALAPEWAGRARLRLSSLDPAQLDARALAVLSECRLICPHLHLSLQSGSAAVLQRMGRGHYTPEQVVQFVNDLSRVWPKFALGADVITGFPGETEVEAAETLAVVRALPLTYAHVFPYSERPGTRAAALPGSIPGHVRRARAAAVRGIVTAKRRVFLESLVGSTCRVAMEPEGHGVNELYVPCRPCPAVSPTVSASRELVPATITNVEKGGLVVRVETSTT